MTATAYDAVVALRQKYDGVATVPIEALDNIIDKHRPDIAAAIANLTGAPVTLPVPPEVVVLVRLPATVDGTVRFVKAATREWGDDLLIRTDLHIDGWFVIARTTEDPT